MAEQAELQLSECQKAGRHLQVAHLNRGRKAHVWMCMKCGEQIGGPKLEEKERVGLAGEAKGLHQAANRNEGKMSEGLEERRCKLCNKPMKFAKTPEGKTIPLDAVAPVYEVRKDLAGNWTAFRTAESVMVSHFATCPRASEASRRRS